MDHIDATADTRFTGSDGGKYTTKITRISRPEDEDTLRIHMDGKTFRGFMKLGLTEAIALRNTLNEITRGEDL